MLGGSLRTNLWMTRKGQVFVTDVVVIDPMWEIVVFNVINWLASVATELNTIAKICKYKGFHEGHHFILMTIEVHGALGCDMDHFI
jgi:hypothetical protein